MKLKDMNETDQQLWANWKQFDADTFRSFRAWALNGSSIEQRMGLYTDVPDTWEQLRPQAAELIDFTHANMCLLKLSTH
jgi:hypothetical protein